MPAQLGGVDDPAFVRHQQTHPVPKILGLLFVERHQDLVALSDIQLHGTERGPDRAACRALDRQFGDAGDFKQSIESGLA